MIHLEKDLEFHVKESGERDENCTLGRGKLEYGLGSLGDCMVFRVA